MPEKSLEEPQNEKNSDVIGVISTRSVMFQRQHLSLSLFQANGFNGNT